jgi:hypothetical protein
MAWAETSATGAPQPRRYNFETAGSEQCWPISPSQKLLQSRHILPVNRTVYPLVVIMASSLLQIFEQYQKARVQFVQSVAEAATRPQNIDVMQNAGVMQLLRPLLLDNVCLYNY